SGRQAEDASQAMPPIAERHLNDIAERRKNDAQRPEEVIQEGNVAAVINEGAAVINEGAAVINEAAAGSEAVEVISVAAEKNAVRLQGTATEVEGTEGVKEGLKRDEVLFIPLSMPWQSSCFFFFLFSFSNLIRCKQTF
ncbi:MAG: hypothetical protein M0Z75_08755, partial [Nitrospiraceae bacterium]|nr:hypothetical protein [Nitrospiraceae bacterium]